MLAIPGFAAWAAETPSRFPDPIIWAPFNAQDLIASPKDAINVFDFEPIARKNVPPAHFGYMASSIDDEASELPNWRARVLPAPITGALSVRRESARTRIVLERSE